MLPNSVLGGCLGGHVFVGTIINRTHADWTTVDPAIAKTRPCTMLAMDPNNAAHFIYTKPPLTYQSMDGGKTYESLNHSNIFHAGIDRKGALYTAAMGGAYVSHDCGPGPNMRRPCSWQAYYDNRTARRPPHAARIRVPHDYQRICLDFGGTVAHVSDQGLFIVNYTNSSHLELIKANGDLSNNIDFCRSCLSAVAPGCSRWTSYYCDTCRPHVIVLNRLAGRCIVPIGPHSTMNGVFHSMNGQPVLGGQAEAFADQLSTLFRNQTSIHDLAADRICVRLHDFDVRTHAILATDYLDRCFIAGWDNERGFVDFMLSIGEGLDEHAARYLWNTTPDFTADQHPSDSDGEW